jgi:uncharacterized protein YkuJ
VYKTIAKLQRYFEKEWFPMIQVWNYVKDESFTYKEVWKYEEVTGKSSREYTDQSFLCI